MRCPRCHIDDTKVIDSREADEGASIRRRRSCVGCGHRFTTFERADEVPLVVRKSRGLREPFDRAKIVRGLSAASKGRPVSTEQIESLAERVEENARASGGEVTSAELGRQVLEGLRGLDDVAYLRFASVYKNFDAAADFQREVGLMKKMQRS
jgi:transcriptional repressor NrdR